MTDPLRFLGLFVAAYAAGSINFAILVFRFTGRDDPRRQGSGNPGATNVYRQAGLRWAAAVLLLDMGRAVAIALAAGRLLPAPFIPWIGFGLILGNRWPCWHGFKGGKGVANYLGFTAGVVPVWALIGALAWGVAHLIWRTPFISSFALIACLTAGTITAAGAGGVGSWGAVATAAFIVASHHRNIRERWGRGR